MRSRTWGWWRPLVGLLLFAVVYLLLAVAATVAGLLGLVASGTDVNALPDVATSDLTNPWSCCSSTPR